MNALALAKIAAFSAETLAIDPKAETDKIVAALREQLRRHSKKRGLVLGLSGGIDSSVCAALAARAVGAEERLRAVHAGKRFRSRKPAPRPHGGRDLRHCERDREISGQRSQAMGCYERRDDFIRQLVPDYGKGWACKVVIANALERDGYTISSLVVQSPDGKTEQHRMPPSVYLGIVAATNMKQRTRKQLEYYHADRLNFAVIGTPNRLEYDQGFFVKNGDGAADVKPIAHLYKSQVYQLAAYLGVPEEIRRRPPTTDT